jgi:hypothetical protein
VKRLAYGARGEERVFPLDGDLNLPKDSDSHGLRERLAFEVARGSFDEAVLAIETTTGGKLPKRQAEEWAAKVSPDFGAFYQHHATPSPEETLDPLVMNEDGKGIAMRKEDLREATKRGRSGTVTSSRPVCRRGEAQTQGDGGGGLQHRAAGAHARIHPGRGSPEGRGTPSASAPQPGMGERRAQPEQVIEEVVEEAREGKRPWVTLADELEDIHAQIDRSGSRSRSSSISSTCSKYLSKAAWSFFAPGDEGAKAWVGARAITHPRGQGQRCGHRHAAQCHLAQSSPKTSAKGSVPARTISSNTVRCCTTTAISPRASPSLPALSKGPSATSSKTRPRA